MFGVFTEDGLDQVVETKVLALQEKVDLMEMGCTVYIRQHDDEEWFELVDEFMRDGFTFLQAVKHAA